MTATTRILDVISPEILIYHIESLERIIPFTDLDTVTDRRHRMAMHRDC